MSNISKYENVSDEEIVRLIVEEKNTRLFDILYQRYIKKVHDKTYNLLENSALSQDAVQVIFIRVYDRLESFRGSASFSSWLYSITYNYCIDFLRRQKKLHYPEWNHQNELPEIIDESESDFSGIDEDVLMSLLDEIHPEEKVLLVMKYLDDISIREISHALRISESAAKMRLKRARTRLLFIYQEKMKKIERNQ
ncbi:MAG: RNA polymerase sigma factor [Bacteroidales bacterium]|nr:RNA polymerase sigma factor [Bacteroidales bacterium]